MNKTTNTFTSNQLTQSTMKRFLAITASLICCMGNEMPANAQFHSHKFHTPYGSTICFITSSSTKCRPWTEQDEKRVKDAEQKRAAWCDANPGECTTHDMMKRFKSCLAKVDPVLNSKFGLKKGDFRTKDQTGFYVLAMNRCERGLDPFDFPQFADL